MEALAFGLAWAAAAALSAGAAGLLERGRVTAVNYCGRTVPQGAGFVLPLAYMVGTGILALAGRLPSGVLWQGAAGCFALGLAGFVDDAAGRGEPKGWLGHGRALACGRLTAGGFKALTGLCTAALIAAGAGGAAAAGAVVMGANAVNSADTRPGRALLLLLIGGAALAAVAGPSAVLPLLPMAAAMVGLLPAELRERLMLGDAGANAAGFVLGWSWALAGPVPALVFAVAAGMLVLAGDRVHLGEKLQMGGRTRGRHG